MRAAITTISSDANHQLSLLFIINILRKILLVLQWKYLTSKIQVQQISFHFTTNNVLTTVTYVEHVCCVWHDVESKWHSLALILDINDLYFSLLTVVGNTITPLGVSTVVRVMLNGYSHIWAQTNVHFRVLSWFLCHVVIMLQHVGDLGNIIAGPDGRASFRLEDSQLKVTLPLETSAFISSLTQRWPCCRCGTWSADRWSLMPGRTTWVEAVTLCQDRREILGKGGFGMEVTVALCTTCA